MDREQLKQIAGYVGGAILGIGLIFLTVSILGVVLAHRSSEPGLSLAGKIVCGIGIALAAVVAAAGATVLAMKDQFLDDIEVDDDEEGGGGLRTFPKRSAQTL